MLLRDFNFWRLLRGVRDRYEARAMGHSAPGRYCIHIYIRMKGIGHRGIAYDCVAFPVDIVGSMYYLYMVRY